MKHITMLVLTTVVMIATMLVFGGPTASAAVPCKTTSTPCTSSYEDNTTFHAVVHLTLKLATTFKTIECSSATFHGHLFVVFIPPEEILPVVILTDASLGGCNCDTKVLHAGELVISHISGTDNGTVKSNGTELTASCSSIFGTVHCIYATENTDMGTLVGGNPAKLKVEAVLPRLKTDSLCSEKANMSAEYEIDTPKPLYIEPE